MTMPENNKDSFRLLRCLDSLTFISISVEFRPSADISQKAWIGAAVRNRFLSSAETVLLPEGDTLRERLDTLCLDKGHFLYKQLSGGFPKGYIFDVSSLSSPGNEYSLLASETYKFKILLVGRMIELRPYVIDAIQAMLKCGLGTPGVPLDLVGLNVGGKVSLRNFAKRCFEGDVTVSLRLKTPLALTRPVDELKSGYQSRLNGFPSFFQWISSAAYRLATLAVLYSDGGMAEIKSKDEWEASVEDLISPAVRSWMLNAELKYVSLRSTPKKGSDKVYVMSGYVGTLTYGRVSPYYVPLLGIMSRLAIGNDVNFGLGQYQCVFYDSVKY